MWFKSRGFIRLLVGVVTVTLITLLLWRHEQQEYAGELRVFFRQLDLDSDGALTLQEWMAYYGPPTHAWAQCSGRIFQLADCDGDQRLSWEEFSAPYLRRNFRGYSYCGERVNVHLLQKPVLDARTGLYILLPPIKHSNPYGPARAGNIPPVPGLPRTP